FSELKNASTGETVTASGNSLAGACVLQLAKPVAPGNRGLLVEGVADLSDAAERLARVAIRREFVPGEQQRRAQSAAVITVDHNGKIRHVRADARRPTHRALGCAACRGVPRLLPQPAGPEQVLIRA